MGIPMGIHVGMGWVWGLKCHPHGSPDGQSIQSLATVSVSTVSSVSLRINYSGSALVSGMQYNLHAVQQRRATEACNK